MCGTLGAAYYFKYYKKKADNKISTITAKDLVKDPQISDEVFFKENTDRYQIDITITAAKTSQVFKQLAKLDELKTWLDKNSVGSFELTCRGSADIIAHNIGRFFTPETQFKVIKENTFRVTK